MGINYGISNDELYPKDAKISKMIANTITIISCLIIFATLMLIVLH